MNLSYLFRSCWGIYSLVIALTLLYMCSLREIKLLIWKLPQSERKGNRFLRRLVLIMIAIKSFAHQVKSENRQVQMLSTFVRYFIEICVEGFDHTILVWYSTDNTQRKDIFSRLGVNKLTALGRVTAARIHINKLNILNESTTHDKRY